MAMISGSEILARSLKAQGVETLFYLMGGPMMDAEEACIREGIRAIDVRHEQAAAMMAYAWGRMTKKVGVCMSCSGPGATNLLTGVATVWADAAPLVVISGSAAATGSAGGRGIFQEMDQVAVFRPVTKWADRVLSPLRIPDMVATAFRQAASGRPGPVYLDVPGDVLYSSVDEASVSYCDPALSASQERPAGSIAAIRRAVDLICGAERPILLSGNGTLWSDAADEFQSLVETAGIPFYTTPQGRGVVPDDHELSFLSARSTAFRDADLFIVVGTRSNYVNGHLGAPRFNPSAKVIQVNIDPHEIGLTRSCDVGLVGDAKSVLQQLTTEFRARRTRSSFEPWVCALRDVNAKKSAAAASLLNSDSDPIHPLRLCKEIRDFLDRDAILIVDGREILNYARQSIPTFLPRHRMNSGTLGTMGVGVPYGVGAKLACPDKQVLVLHGDGSFGMNCMELDTAVRFKVPFVTVISLNGGWTAREAGKNKAGRELAFTRYDKMAEALGCHGEYVERAEEIRPALIRASRAGVPAVVNVKTDPYARSSTTSFSEYGAT